MCIRLIYVSADWAGFFPKHSVNIPHSSSAQRRCCTVGNTVTKNDEIIKANWRRRVDDK